MKRSLLTLPDASTASTSCTSTLVCASAFGVPKQGASNPTLASKQKRSQFGIDLVALPQLGDLFLQRLRHAQTQRLGPTLGIVDAATGGPGALQAAAARTRGQRGVADDAPQARRS